MDEEHARYHCKGGIGHVERGPSDIFEVEYCPESGLVGR